MSIDRLQIVRQVPELKEDIRRLENKAVLTREDQRQLISMRVALEDKKKFAAWRNKPIPELESTIERLENEAVLTDDEQCQLTFMRLVLEEKTRMPHICGD